MRWRFVPGNPDNDDAACRNGHLDRIVVSDTHGEEVALGYLIDIATWYAENNVRQGYAVAAEGGAFKGPYALQWERIEIAFDECGAVAMLREHLLSAWGPENQHLGQIGERRLERLD